jgi:hypothetical protein
MARLTAKEADDAHELFCCFVVLKQSDERAK